MARAGWDNLSAGYRSRLERGGITREAYSRGDSLSRARGHANDAAKQAFKAKNDLLGDFGRNPNGFDSKRTARSFKNVTHTRDGRKRTDNELRALGNKFRSSAVRDALEEEDWETAFAALGDDYNALEYG